MILDRSWTFLDTHVQDEKPRRQAKNRPSDAVLGQLGRDTPLHARGQNMSKMSKNPENGPILGSGAGKTVLDNDVQELSKNVQELPHVAELVERLERGWKWFDENPGHPQFEQREDRWIAWLREYEAAVR